MTAATAQAAPPAALSDTNAVATTRTPWRKAVGMAMTDQRTIRRRWIAMRTHCRHICGLDDVLFRLHAWSAATPHSGLSPFLHSSLRSLSIDPFLHSFLHRMALLRSACRSHLRVEVEGEDGGDGIHLRSPARPRSPRPVPRTPGRGCRWGESASSSDRPGPACPGSAPASPRRCRAAPR